MKYSVNDLTLDEKLHLLTGKDKWRLQTDGAEVSQVYVRDPFASVERPEKELKGFAKTALKAEESKRVSITLNARSFAYYSIARKGWYVENGDFEILIGASSRDIRLSDTVKIQLPPNTQNSQ